ncbi:hypothetical protein PVAR5_5963 [Paecilomyces variotii No. 5]|uniref:Uncharacterized protein n=1 Tax=Byssochlamys spectabilis (strain No. 5 / NBRC 109023) TaxID=1356009 RepID=V5FHS4_BYSSN|nr:hypothetical protein PVAR5_5963 [Paecilomyces variotii No. 5]
MVTGFETAGLILAILPLLVNQVDGYARGLEKIRSLRRYQRELMRYSTGLSAQYAILLNTLELLLENVVDDHEERLELISNPRGSGWTSTQFQEKLLGKLGRNYYVVMSTTKELSDMLERLSEKLDLGKTDKLNTESPDIVKNLKFRMIFSKPVYDDLLSKIDSTNQILKTLSEQSHQRSIQSRRDGRSRRWKKSLAKYQAARRHATALYNLVIQGHCWKCGCRDIHSVYFDMNTTPAQDQAGFCKEEKAVDSAERTSGISWYEIETEPCPEPTITTRPFNSTQGVSPTNAGKAKLLFNTVAPEENCISSSHENHIFSLALPIYDLCSTLKGFDVGKSNSGLIGYIPNNQGGTRYNMRIIRDLEEEFQDLSLHDMILASSSKRSLDCLGLSRRDRLFIATILANGLLLFHGTWLKEQWSSHDIKFPRNGGLDSTIIDHPCLSWKVLGRSVGNECNNLPLAYNSLGSRHVKNHILFPLALALVELSLGQTISEICGSEDELCRWQAAATVLPKVYRESGSNYGDVVKECLYWSNSKGEKFGNYKFEESVYEVILSPLLRDFAYFEALPPRMDVDHLAEERSDRIFQVWLQNLIRNSPRELAGKLAAKHRQETPVSASRPFNGAFNICYRVTYKDGYRVIVRFTALGRVTFRNEKVENEVLTMDYLAQHTTLLVPKVLGHGKCAVGPYIVMTFVEGNPLSEYLRDPKQEMAGLNSQIPISVLKRAYSNMAEIMLELSKPTFPYIGALGQDDSGTWIIQKGPFTFNMNRLTQFSNIPPGVFAKQRFTNAADYFEEVAKQHFYHLEFQQNDAVTDAADCRKKYVARCLFIKIARQVSQKHCKRPFRLFCDDLRPENVLVHPTQPVVTGVIDWEFTYAAPVEFSYAAPWWLLLERPEEWDLGSFLRLSKEMEASMENGLFWICVAMRYSSMCDEIYWSFIDPMHHGSFTSIEDRLRILSEEEQAIIDSFVENKMQQASERKLADNFSVDELVDL